MFKKKERNEFTAMWSNLQIFSHCIYDGLLKGINIFCFYTFYQLLYIQNKSLEKVNNTKIMLREHTAISKILAKCRKKKKLKLTLLFIY